MNRLFLGIDNDRLDEVEDDDPQCPIPNTDSEANFSVELSGEEEVNDDVVPPSDVEDETMETLTDPTMDHVFRRQNKLHKTFTLEDDSDVEVAGSSGSEYKVGEDLDRILTPIQIAVS